MQANWPQEYEYKVGGSLPPHALCYVTRDADRQLLAALEQGEFCYVLNCRQMGKSSLKARTIQLLEARGFACAAVDVTKLGTKQVTADRWYKGLVVELARVFNIYRDFDLKAWRNELVDLSALQQLSMFIEDVLLTRITQAKICIFLEEIDNVKSLDFSTDDLFSLMRACYEQRTSNPTYQRLTFCLLGVAAPSDLISDKKRTPFNIGQSIDLTGFTFAEAQAALTPGLATTVAQPDLALAEILAWTGGQPFLTQKLCSLVARSPDNQRLSIAQIVQSSIIDNWDVRDTPPHLKTIRDRLKGNGKRQVRLLAIYQKILLAGEIDADDSSDQMELQLSGLVVKQQGKLRVYNRIYQRVFDRQWVERALFALRPDFYSVALAGWLVANRAEESWLLRGKVLQDAQKWAADKSLSDDDYRFLDASRELEQQDIQRRLDAEAEAAYLLAEANQVLADANQTLERANHKAKQQIQIGGIILALSLAGAIFAGVWASIVAQAARVERINALSISATASMGAHRELEALVAALQAGVQLQAMQAVDEKTQQSVRLVLQRSLFQIREHNRLEGHEGKVRRVKFSPDGQTLATASEDGTVRIWSKEGKAIKKFGDRERQFRSVSFSPDGKTIAALDARHNMTLWDREGKELLQVREQDREDNFMADLCFIRNGQAIVQAANHNQVRVRTIDGRITTTLIGHQSPIWSIACSDKQQIIVTADLAGLVKIWNFDGRSIQSFQASKQSVFGVAISPDGRTIATATGDPELKLWNLQGRELKKIPAHSNSLTSVGFSPDGKTIFTTSSDKTIKLWHANTGQELASLPGHNDEVLSASFSPDGQTLATAAGDASVKLWHLADTRQKDAIGHQAALWSIDFSAQPPYTIASAGDDKTIKFWNLAGEEIASFPADSPSAWNRIGSLKFSPDGQTLATAGYDRTIRLWNRQGKNLRTWQGHREAVTDVSFSPSGQTIASASEDGTIKLWTIEGRLLQTMVGQGSKVLSVAFSPDGRQIASAHSNGRIQLWDLEGNLRQNQLVHRGPVTSVSFSPNGKIIASASGDKTIQLWHLDNEVKMILRGHTAEVTKVNFSPNGQTIASASADNTLRIWDVSSGEELKTLTGKGYPFWNVRYSPDGKTLASVSDRGLVQLWNAETPSFDRLIGQSCDWLRDYLRYSSKIETADRQICDRR